MHFVVTGCRRLSLPKTPAISGLNRQLFRLPQSAFARAEPRGSSARRVSRLRATGGGGWFDEDFHVRVGPAALEAAAALAGHVVRLRAQDVLARDAEGGRGGRSAIGFVDLGLGIAEGHSARAAKLTPGNCHGGIP